MNRTTGVRLTAALLLSGALLGVAGCSAITLPPGPTITWAPSPTASAVPTKEPKPPTQLSITNVCLRAANLIKVDRKPQAALDLIDKTRAPAIDALAGHQPLSADMTDLLEACGPERRAAVAAIAAGVEPEPKPKPWAQQVQGWWESVLKNWITPLAGPGIAVGVLFVSLVIAARLFSLAPGIRDRKATVAEQGRLWKVGLGLIAIGSIAIVYAFTKLGDTVGLPATILFVAGLAVIAGIGVNRLALFLATRLQLDVQMYGKTETKDEWSTASLVATIGRMSERSNYGTLQITDGADIKALTDADLPETPVGGVIDAVKRVLIFLFSGTPWRIVVRTDADGKRASVTIVRNGASVSQVNIDVGPLDLPKDVDANLAIRACAGAVVILALSEKHEGFEGLYGTTDWLSLGLTYLALRRLNGEGDDAKRFLTLAVAQDPGNHIAQVGLQDILHRKAGGAEELGEYARWLADEADALNGMWTANKAVPRILETRVRALFLAMTSNARATDPGWWYGLGPGAVLENADRLRKLLEEDRITNTEERTQLRHSAALVYAGLPFTPQSDAMAKLAAFSSRSLAVYPYNLTAVANLNLFSIAYKGARELQSNDTTIATLSEPWRAWYRDAIDLDMPLTAYNAACHLAVTGAPVRSVLNRLKIGVRDPSLKEWSLEDPELTSIRANPGFRELTSPPRRADFWELDAFASHKEKLTASGFTTPGELPRLRRRRRVNELEVYLAIQAPETRNIVRLGQLTAAMVSARSLAPAPNPAISTDRTEPIKGMEVEIAAAMLAQGIHAPADLSTWVTANGLSASSPFPALVAELNEKFNSNLVTSGLVTWLRHIANYSG